MRRIGEDVTDGAELMGARVPWLPGWTAQQVIDTLEPFVNTERRERLQAVVAQRIGAVTVLLDAPHDPHNGAAVLRSAEAFGLPEIHVVPRVESFRLARSVTRGCERWMNVVEHPSAAAAIAALGAGGYTLVATHPDGELAPADLPAIPRLALLFGNEHRGLCAELAQAANASVRIPMRGFVESLNVSVAAAVLLEAATRGRAGDLDSAERHFLYAKGLFRSVSRANEVLAESAARAQRANPTPSATLREDPERRVRS